MRLKKANAYFGLLTVLLLLTHAIYQMVAFLLFIYNPLVSKVLGFTCAGCLALHVILAMTILFFCHDGSALTEYPGLNMRTVLQRGSGIGALVVLLPHIKAFGMLSAGIPGLIAAEVTQFLFFSFVYTHVATSLSNALITLGLLGDMDKKKKIDKAVYIICGILWLASVAIVGFTFVQLSHMQTGGSQ